MIVIGDGMADYPVKELGKMTPLEKAAVPNLDYLAKGGFLGRVRTIPRGISPASDVATLSILGYNPKKYYPGRGPLEAANMGITLGENDIAFRCNLITEADGILADYSAGHIRTNEARLIIQFLDKKLGSENASFHPGVSYRHIFILRNADFDPYQIKSFPPHDIIGNRIEDYLPKGKGSEVLKEIMKESLFLLRDHPVNSTRLDLGENPGNMVWLWGGGRRADLTSFYQRYHLSGTVVSAVDIIKGIGKVIGLRPLEVEGATGYLDTNYQGKVEAATSSLKKDDFSFLHIEAPDEAGHSGISSLKIRAIEDLDSKVIGPLWRNLETNFKDRYRLLILSDHITSLRLRTHTSDPVPFLIYGKGIEANGAKGFNEIEARRFYLKKATDLLPLLFK